MIYEHDPEFPFQKVLVKDGNNGIGVIRGHIKTGHDQYFEARPDALPYETGISVTSGSLIVGSKYSEDVPPDGVMDSFGLDQ